MHTRNLFILLALFLPFISHAQLEKGMRQFEDNSEYGFIFGEGSTILVGLMSHRQNWMLSDHFMVGANYGGGIISGGGITEPVLIGGPNLRYYINPGNTKTNFYLGLEAQATVFFGDGEGNLAVEPQLGLNTFIQEDVSIRARLIAQLNSDIDEVVFVLAADLESFFKRDAWKSRRSVQDPSQKGTFLLGDPQASFSFLPGGTNTIEINTGLGYFFSNDFVGGLELGFGDAGGIFRTFRIVPYARYYLSKARTSWFLQGEGGPNLISVNNFFGPGRTSETIWEYFGGAGFNKFLSPNVAIEAKIGVSGRSQNTATTFAGQFGMQYYINR